MSQVLIIEDEEALADSLKDILEGEGHQVLTARNGLDALDVLAREKPELVLLDLMLPLVDGFTVLETLQRDRPATAVIAVTSCAPKVLEGHSVQGFLRKPFSLEALLDTVRTVLARSRPPPSRS